MTDATIRHMLNEKGKCNSEKQTSRKTVETFSIPIAKKYATFFHD